MLPSYCPRRRIYNHFYSFVCLPFTIFSQKLIIWLLIQMSTAFQPSSAWNIYAAVDFLELVVYLRYSVWSFSMILVFISAKISHPYRAFGKIVCSKSCICKSIGRFKFRIILYKRCIAFLAWSWLCFLALQRLLLFVKTIINTWIPYRLRNIKILVFFIIIYPTSTFQHIHNIYS